jgi:hypothetical protein
LKQIKLKKKRAYGHIIIDIPEENAYADIQVKTEEEGIVVDCFSEDGLEITTFCLFYDDIQKEVSNGNVR